jgi:hypothetical protein
VQAVNYEPIGVALGDSPHGVAVHGGQGASFFAPVDPGGTFDALPWDVREVLHDLQVHALQLEQMQAHLAQLVAEARGRGTSWAMVGWSLGMTRDGARKRFSDGVPHQRGPRD